MANAKGGLSAGDWIRLKRLNSSKGYGYTTGNASGSGSTATQALYPLNKDIAPPEPGQLPYGKALLIPYEGAGTSKILRPASSWTDYIASQTGDFVTSAQAIGANGRPINSTIQSVTKICSAVTDSTTITNKSALPMSNQVNRLKMLS